MAPFENQWSQEDLYTVNPFLIGDGWPMFRSKFAIRFRECIWVLARVDFQPGSFFTDKTANGMKGEEIVILNTVSCKSGSIPTSLGYYRIFAQTPPTSHITHILGEEKHFFLRFFVFFRKMGTSYHVCHRDQWLQWVFDQQFLEILMDV